jgi:tight adherence protein C
MLIAILVLIFTAVTLIVMAFARSKGQEDISQRVKRLQVRVNTGALQAHHVAAQSGKVAQAVAQSKHWLAPLVKRTITAERIAGIQPLLAQAGNHDQSPEDFISQQVFLGVASPLVFLFLDLLVFKAEIGVSIMAVLGSALLGFRWPIAKLRRMAKMRQQAVFRALPDTLDLLTICVEAGLGINAALQAVVSRGRPGPMRDELERTLREMQLGKPRIQAWRDLASRVALRELTSFSIAMVQAEQMGTGLAKTLKVQSQLLREARWRYAQELAQTAPVKMAIPLALFIFPVIFIVIFGPILLKFLMGTM